MNMKVVSTTAVRCARTQTDLFLSIICRDVSVTAMQITM